MKVTKKDRHHTENVNIPIQDTNLLKKKDQTYTVQMFGKRLVELRNERNLSQQQSADLIGISRNTLSMYERCERCASIDIAVNVANKYNVTLDYLFGTGYKTKEHNDSGLYGFGFSEDALDLLLDHHVLGFVDAVLSHPAMKKVIDLMYGVHYKPLINSYETNYISRLISDMLYHIIVNINKEAYKLRPMSEDEELELLDAVRHCISNIERKESLLCTDYDNYVDCEDDIISELERIQVLLENSESCSIVDAKNEGFQLAIKMITNGELFVPSPMSSADQEELSRQLSDLQSSIDQEHC